MCIQVPLVLFIVVGSRQCMDVLHLSLNVDYQCGFIKDFLFTFIFVFVCDLATQPVTEDPTQK